MMKILYLMNVDWNWIKQRPHFIAEMIEKTSSFEVIVMYKKAYQKKLLINNEYRLKNKPIEIPKLPFSSKFSLILKINTIIEALFLKNKIKECDIIYVTHPTFFPSINNVNNKRVIYDCMDDFLGFQLPKRVKAIIDSYEKRIIEKAYLTIFSSNHLQKTVHNRVNINFNSIVINNAINIPQKQSFDSVQLKELFDGKKGRIVSYIGTVSEWFDYDLLVNVVKNKPSLIFYIFGPVDAKFENNENIRFFGPQNYKDVFFIMQQSDVLIMPFKVTELIKSVNPVKLYEYIYSTKPVISVKYDETLLFEEYIYLYESGSTESLLNVFQTLEDNQFKSKRTAQEAIDFATSNTWENRTIQLLDYICK